MFDEERGHPQHANVNDERLVPHLYLLASLILLTSLKRYFQTIYCMLLLSFIRELFRLATLALSTILFIGTNGTLWNLEGFLTTQVYSRMSYIILGTSLSTRIYKRLLEFSRKR